MLDLVAPTDLDLNDSHVLSFLFGTSMETEYIKCGWDNANVLNDGQTPAYFSRQHNYTPIATMFNQPFFVNESKVIYSWTSQLPTIEKNRLKCRGSKPYDAPMILFENYCCTPEKLRAHFQFRSNNDDKELWGKS